MAFRPGRAVELTFDAEEAIGVQTQDLRPHHVNGVQRVADDHLLRGKTGVQPVQRRLPFLEVMQVDPAARLAIHADHDGGRAPVGFLDAGLEENHPLQLADDVMFVTQRVDLLRAEVLRVATVSNFRQQRPVLFADFHHVVEPRIVLKGHLGQTKVRPLAGVRRDDVVDDHRIVRRCHARQRLKLGLGAQLRVDVETDSVEIAVNRRRMTGAAQAAGLFQRAVVNALDADPGQRVPQGFVAKSLKHRAIFTGDDGRRVRSEPHRRQRRGVTRSGLRVGLLPQPTLPRVEPGPLPGGEQHRLPDQPVHVILLSCRHRPPPSENGLRPALAKTPPVFI
ncbi:hypothetical protein D3C73_576600 [compost metagenome]